MSETSNDSLGGRIARYRKLAGVSADQLAERAGEGLTRSIIANLENDRKRDVTVSQLLALAYVLGVPPVALVFDLLDPYGYKTLIDTETNHVQAQHWLAYDWFGGVITPTQLVVRIGDEDKAPPVLEGDNSWNIHYLLKNRAWALYGLDAQNVKVEGIEKNAREFNSWGALGSDTQYQDAKQKVQGFAADLYAIEGQLRKLKVMIDKTITPPGMPF